jgi:broad specificity phosphatase PhoE
VWTSTLVRTQQTAAHLGPHVTHVAKAELDEINAGICDGLSYEQVPSAALCMCRSAC